MSELSFFWTKPTSRAGSIRQEKETAKSDKESDNTFKNEEPRKVSPMIIGRVETYHLQPDIPALPSSPSNTPAAIREEKPVAVI